MAKVANSTDQLERGRMALVPEIAEPISPGAPVSLYVFPQTYVKESTGGAGQAPGLELLGPAFCLFAGTLTEITAPQLSTALTLIKSLQGCDTTEALASLAHPMLLVAEHQRAQLDLPSFSKTVMYFEGDSERARQAAVAEQNRPRLSIEQVLQFWTSAGGKFSAARLYKSPDGSIGRPWFYSFPPLWMTPEKLAKLNPGSGTERNVSVPVHVHPTVAEAVQSYASFVRSASPGTLTFSLTKPPSLPDARIELPPPQPLRLSTMEEAEFKHHGFHSRVPIHITGSLQARSGNIVQLNEEDALLTDAPLRLLLRLMVALFETDDGYVARGSMGSGGGLISEGLYSAASIDQAVSRLRMPLHTALHGLPPTDFIQVARGKLRLSTHRAYVSWNGKLLAAHTDAQIRALTKRLEDAKRALQNPRPG